MFPTKTTYRILINSPKDEAAIYAIWRRFPKVCGRKHALALPTVVAERDGRIVGFLATKITKKAIVAGPMIVDLPGQRMFVALRMIDAYRATMRTLGITRYVFFINRENKSYLNAVLQFGKTPFRENKNGYWFAEDLARDAA